MPDFLQVIADGAKAIYDLIKQGRDWFAGDFGTLHWGGMTVFVNAVAVQSVVLPSDACYDVQVINSGPDAIDCRFPDDEHVGWLTFASGQSGTAGGVRRSSVGTAAFRINGTLTTGATVQLQCTWIEAH